MADKQKQKGGDNSQLVQAETAIIGIDEQRARQIYYELFDRQVKDLAYEASVIAAQRIGVFEGKIINRLEKVESAFENFRDPEYLACVLSAENTAMQTDDEKVYEVLAELLAHKIQRKNEKKIGTGIKQAIQIAHDIDDDSLLGLTCYFFHYRFVINTNNNHCFINGSKLLEMLNDYFSKIITSNLPQNDEWLDQLDVLGCIRISVFSRDNSFENDLINRYEGIFCNGILKTSPDYSEAIELLKNNGLPQSILVDHEYAKNAIRMSIVSESAIDNLQLNRSNGQTMNLTQKQKDALKKIFALCKKDSSRINEIKESLSDCIKNYPFLKRIRDWLNNIDTDFAVTSVGRILAFTNTKRNIPDLPELY